MTKLLQAAAAALLFTAAAPAQANVWSTNYADAMGKVNGYAGEYRTAQTPEERCAAQGKRYYEKTQGASFFGMRLGKGQVVWSGCLSEYEALQAQQGIDAFNQAETHRMLTPPRTYGGGTCYGTATTYGNQTFTNASCY